ncbi:hypothetical protein ACFLZB_01870 [Nanoarchaeota archaeon]
MVQLEKQQKTIIIGILIALAVFAVFAQYGDITGFAVAGAITSQRLVWPNGSTATLVYDDNTSTYTDFSLENDNMFVEICSDNAAVDLLNQYIKLVYRVQTTEVDLSVLPAQITSGDINGSGCALIDLDTNLFSAYYPGIVTIAKDSTPFFNSSPTYYPLTQTTGFLSGNYTTVYEQVGGNLVYSVYDVLDDQGNNITTSLPYMVLGIYNGSGLINTTIVTPGQNVTIPYPGGDFSFVVNSFNVTFSYNLDALEDCTNLIDDNLNGFTDCEDTDCASHPACLAPQPSRGGGGGGRSACQPNWECSPWGNCQLNNTQTRICYDSERCEEKGAIIITEEKPEEIQTCDYLPQCDDSIQNQDESDVDCGGETCAQCPLGKNCHQDNDCMSENCLNGVCAPYGIECYVDNDCGRTFICQENQCVFTGEIRMPIPSEIVTTAELIIIFSLLAVILIASSFYTYQKYLKTGIHQYKQTTKTKQVKETTQVKQNQKKVQILTEFINNSKLDGFSKEDIKKALVEKGWPKNTVNKYLNQAFPQQQFTSSKKPTNIKEQLKYYQEQLKNLKK